MLSAFGITIFFSFFNAKSRNSSDSCISADDVFVVADVVVGWHFSFD